MGTECLGPKKSTQQVYVKIIKSIHNDSQYLNQYEIAQQNLFVSFLDKLNKQGDLRKLAENLSSRKGKIQQALALNHRLVTGNKHLGGTLSGFFILNCISDVAYPKKIQVQPESLQKSELSSNLSFFKKSSGGKLSPATSKKVPLQSYKILNVSSVNSMVDEHFFKLMRILYSRDEMLKKKVMQSINRFCLQHPGVISNQTQLWGLIKLIINDLRNNERVQECTKTMRNLVLKTKDQMKDEMRNREMLEILLMLWLQRRDECEIKQYCFEMLDRIFDLFVSAWESEFLCQCLFSVFDSIQFEELQTNQLDKLCQQLIENSEFKTNFMRYMFNYLLSYLLLSQSNSNHKKWLMISLGTSTENSNIIYKNGAKHQIKMAALKRMNKWIDRHYIDINQLHTFDNHKILISLYASILISPAKNTKQSSQILKQFKTTLSKMTPGTLASLFQQAIEQFQDREIHSKQQSSIFQLIKLIINQKLVPKQELEQILYFIPIEVNEEHDKKMEIINFNFYLLTILDHQPNTVNNKLQFCQRIAQYLGSFYENFVTEEISFNNKWVLLQRHEDFLQQLERQKYFNILRAYYEIICKKSNANIKKIRIESQYCLILSGFKLRKIVTREPLPQNLLNLHTKIQRQENKLQAISYLNTYFFNPDTLEDPSRDEKTQTQEFEEQSRIFHKIFMSNKLDRLDSLDRRHGFSRCVSLDGESQKNSENDKSFEDAIDILHQK